MAKPLGDRWSQRRTRSDGEPDGVLVARARDERASFAPLYRRHVEAVHRYCYRRLGERTAAEDATSQVFAKALKSLPDYREDAGIFRAWLFGIAHHVVTDALRRRRPAVEVKLGE